MPALSDLSWLFYWLAVESPWLRELLRYIKEILPANAHIPLLIFIHNIGKTRSVAEPALSISDELVLQNFFQILRTVPDDNALLSAIMLTFSFAAASGHFNKDCLEYQSAALVSVRKRIGSPNKANMESTFGAFCFLLVLTFV